jgi:RNA polymerase sigma-70 factor, ECF subfamily
MIVMLECLNDSERAALTMREILGYSYSEIATKLYKSEDACRQLVHRGKSAIRRFSAYSSPNVTRPVAALMDAIRRGDEHAIMHLVQG